MKKMILVYVFMIFGACTLFKQTSKIKDESFEKAVTTLNKQTETTLDNQKKNLQLVVASDSSDSNYSVHLWPKGLSTFSPGGQISGEFDSVILVGKHKRVRSTAKMHSIIGKQKAVQRDAVFAKNEENAKTSRVEKVKVPQKISVFFLFGLLGFIIFIIIRIVSRVKNPRF